MNATNIKNLIRDKVQSKMKDLEVNKYSEFKLLNKVPELIAILEDLMSDKFNLFVKDVEWVSPKPPEYRVVLENEQYFYLTDLGRSWVATVEGKRYYILNLGEEQMAINAITRLLRYGLPVNPDDLQTLGGTVDNNMEASLDQDSETTPQETESTPVGEIPDDLL